VSAARTRGRRPLRPRATRTRNGAGRREPLELLRDVARQLESRALAGSVYGTMLHAALLMGDAARVTELLQQVKWGVPRPQVELVFKDEP